jgi:hypothetical protein
MGLNTFTHILSRFCNNIQWTHGNNPAQLTAAQIEIQQTIHDPCDIIYWLIYFDLELRPLYLLGAVRSDNGEEPRFRLRDHDHH